MGIELEPGQVAMRCNLVTVVDGVMTSYSAGGISSAEAAELIAALREGLGIASRDQAGPGCGEPEARTTGDWGSTPGWASGTS